MNDDPQLRQSVDTALRTAQQNTLALSAMADQKASVVLGAAFVMASILFGDLTGVEEIETATLLLAVTAVASGVLAALAVMPRVKVGATGSARPNLLFFGSIAQLDREEYLVAMKDVIADGDRIHETILEDIHQASGILLNRKYLLLRLSYLTLIVGMVATLIAVIVD